jgi:hypothetical protein
MPSQFPKESCTCFVEIVNMTNDDSRQCYLTSWQYQSSSYMEYSRLILIHTYIILVLCTPYRGDKYNLLISHSGLIFLVLGRGRLPRHIVLP